MSTVTSGAALKSTGAISDQFPAGLRVLIVDDDPTYLMILEKMLRTCRYEVTKCSRAKIALSLLRGKKNGFESFDIVISDVHMPGMDGFKLLEHIGLEIDLPVIMISADDDNNVVMKCVMHGACDYLIKPARIEVFKNIWQHIVRKRMNEWRDTELPESAEEGDRQQKVSNESSWRNSKERRDEEEEANERDDTSTLKKPRVATSILKKPRVVWTVKLHQRFIAAVDQLGINQLGINKVGPKKILELMNVPGLTKEHIGSHLQKYRLYLRRLSGVSQHQSYMNQTTEMPINNFPLGRTPGISSITTKGSFQEEVTPEDIGAGGVVPKYDIFGKLQKPHDWEVSNANLTYNASSLHATHMHSNKHVFPSVLVPQSFSSNQQMGQGRDANVMIGTPMFSVSESMEQCTIQNQHLNPFVADNSIRFKTDGVPDASYQTSFYSDFWK